jgi:uncharacterized protein
MPRETIAAIVRNLIDDKLLGRHLTVNWHAGEPLVMGVEFYRDALELLHPLSSSGCHIVHSVQTNGTLIDSKWCEFFKEHRIRVGVSVDGPEFIHDAFRKNRRGEGTHAQTMTGIRHLQEAGVPFSVITVLTERSVDYADEIYQFYIENGIKVVGFNIEEIEGAHPESSICLGGFAERYQAFLKQFHYLTRRDGILSVREFQYFRNRILKERAVTNDQVVPLAILSVDANGNFSTFSPELLDAQSDRHGDFVFGNVHQTGFRNALRSDKFLKVYGEINSGVDACRSSCEHFVVCRGGAPSNKQFEHGSMDTTETEYCRYMKKAMANIVLDELMHEFPKSAPAAGVAQA